MTDRHTAYFVTLETPIREDQADQVVTALRQIRGVVDVRPVIAGIEEMAAAMRMQAAWRAAVYDLMINGPGAEKPRS